MRSGTPTVGKVTIVAVLAMLLTGFRLALAKEQEGDPYPQWYYPDR